MDKNYWYDKYAPKKHSQQYWKSRYDNKKLHDQEYYLKNYVNPPQEPKNEPQKYNWYGLEKADIFIILIALFLCLIKYSS